MAMCRHDCRGPEDRAPIVSLITDGLALYRFQLAFGCAAGADRLRPSRLPGMKRRRK